MKKIIYCILILTVFCFFTYNSTEEIALPKDAIRFRIIANSNSDYDQNLKLTIKKELERQLFAQLENVNSREETVDIINSNETLIENTLSKYNVDYKINYGENYFPEKEFNGVKYPAGTYESLVISLGEAAGNNWWCVMYPPLCLLDSSNKKSKVEYKLYIQEIIDKFTNQQN